MRNLDSIFNEFPLTDRQVLFSDRGICAVYTITSVSTGKTYVGSTGCIYYRLRSHIGNLRRNVHPNRSLQAAYNRDSNLKFHFILTDTREQAYDLEQEMMDKYRSQGLLFNRATDARYSGKAHKHTPEAIEKIRIASSQRRHSEYSKKLIGEASKGRSVGLKRSPETIAKMVIHHIGKKRSPETIENISKGRKGKLIGYKHSPEVLAAMKQHAARLNRPVEIEGKRYASINDACVALNLTRGSVVSRLRSEKHKDWKRI